MNPYFADELSTIYRADALEVLPEIPDESVDIVVTSPPYNMGATPGGNGRGLYAHTTQKASRFTNDGYSESGDDALDVEQYAALRAAELWHLWRVARVAVWWNHRPRVIHGVLADPLEDLRKWGHDLPPVRQRIILARPTGIDVNLAHFCTRGEYLYLFAKPGFRLVDHAASGMGDVWEVPIVTNSDHPAPFAPIIPRRCITATGAESVLDPFVGSGTTLAVARALGVRGIGIDRSERFCRMTAARIGSVEAMAEPGNLFAQDPTT